MHFVCQRFSDFQQNDREVKKQPIITTAGLERRKKGKREKKWYKGHAAGGSKDTSELEPSFNFLKLGYVKKWAKSLIYNWLLQNASNTEN